MLFLTDSSLSLIRRRAAGRAEGARTAVGHPRDEGEGTRPGERSDNGQERREGASPDLRRATRETEATRAGAQDKHPPRRLRCLSGFMGLWVACTHTSTSAIYGASCTSACSVASVGWWVGSWGWLRVWVCACVWVCVREVFCGLAAVFTGFLVVSNWKFDGGTTVPPLGGGVSPAGICREWWCGRVRRWLCGH